MTNHKVTTFGGLITAINALKAEQASVRVDSAIADGLLNPEKRPWAIQYCSSNPEGWTTFIGVARKHQAEQRDKHQSEIFHKMGLTEQQAATVKQKLAAKV